MEKKFLAFWHQHQQILDSNGAIKAQLSHISSRVTKSFIYSFLVIGLMATLSTLFVFATLETITPITVFICIWFGGFFGWPCAGILEGIIFSPIRIKKHNKKTNEKYHLLVSHWRQILLKPVNLKIMLEYLAESFKNNPDNMNKLSVLVQKITSNEHIDIEKLIDLNKNALTSIKDCDYAIQAKLHEEKVHQENLLQIKSAFKDLNISLPNEKKKYMEMI